MLKINPFTTIAKSKVGQRVYKSILDPSKDTFWNNTTPLLETTAASACYIISTQVQKDIDDKSKKAMQWQNVLSWVFSIGISAKLNKSVTKFGEQLVKHLKPDIIPDSHKVINGIKVGLPIAVVTLINRFILPTVFVPVSSVIRDKLDTKA